jgi:putative membrane protein
MSPEYTEEESRTIRGSVPPLSEWARVYLIGLFMGTADAVPGVSGGTIALIAGIYERLIAAITAVTPARFASGLGALLPVGGGFDIPRAAPVWESVDGWFLITLLAGIFTAVIGVTGAVSWLNDRYPVILFGFFFGLIAASAVVLLRVIHLDETDEIVAAIAGFLVAFVVAGQAALMEPGGLLMVFVAGAIGVSAMILPGISGSLLLVIIGQYTYLSDSLHAFLNALVGLVRGETLAPVVRHGRVVLLFILGGLVGLFTIARLIRRSLDANRTATLAFLVALVVGALRAPVASLRTRPDVVFPGDALLAFVGASVVGAIAVLVLEWYAVDLDFDAV